jgi:membrane protein DedA with SNARE-associated domain
MKARTFVLLDAVASVVWQLLYFGLGYVIGDPIVVVLQQYAKIANWVAIVLVVVIVGGYFFRSGKTAREAASQASSDGAPVA